MTIGFIASLDGTTQENKMRFIQNFKWTDTLQGNTPRYIDESCGLLGPNVIRGFLRPSSILLIVFLGVCTLMFKLI